MNIPVTETNLITIYIFPQQVDSSILRYHALGLF